MTQQLLSAQKHLSLTAVTVPAPNVLAANVSGTSLTSHVIKQFLLSLSTSSTPKFQDTGTGLYAVCAVYVYSVLDSCIDLYVHHIL